MLKIDLLESGGERSLKEVPVDQLANKSVLVTGASGIIGTHFLYGLKHVREHLGIPVNVIAIVSRSIPVHLIPLSEKKAAHFLIGDLADDAFVRHLPETDFIVHAATYGQPDLFMKQPEVTLKLNTSVTLTLFERILSNDGKLLFVSSSEVYSGLTMSPFTEEQIGTSTPSHPRACYIEAKRCGEAIVNAYRNKGISATSARLSLAYGPGTREGDKRVLNSLIEKALREREIKLLDKGEAKRTYCYISDAVNMMWRILLEGRECVYNVGGTSTVTIAQLAELIGKIANAPVIVPQDGAIGVPGAPEDVRLDISKYMNEFGEREFVELDDGLRSTLEWQRSLYLS